MLMPSQHILRYACKFKSDSAQEAQLTIGILNAKLDELSRAMNKVCDGLLALDWTLQSDDWTTFFRHQPGTARTFPTGVSETSPHVANPAHVGSLHALDREHHHQGSQGAPWPDMYWSGGKVWSGFTSRTQLHRAEFCCADWSKCRFGDEVATS